MQTLHPSPDHITFASVNKLWTLWKDHRAIGQDPERWERLTAAVQEIWAAADGAEDPDFIRDFSVDVLASLNRLNRPTE